MNVCISSKTYRDNPSSEGTGLTFSPDPKRLNIVAGGSKGGGMSSALCFEGPFSTVSIALDAT